MKNFFKNVDMDQVTDGISEIKDQLQELKFRKPWTNGSGMSPIGYMAIGAGLTALGVALYRNRTEVANFCSSCGADLKNKWESSGMKDRAQEIMGKVKNGAKDSADKMKTQANQERFQPT
ncbi:MAG: hypothetical protein JWP91_373 [Fibrobacteres bacterium]|nr:hypothetical protein [Fibrobacterota bacterium]